MVCQHVFGPLGTLGVEELDERKATVFAGVFLALDHLHQRHALQGHASTGLLPKGGAIGGAKQAASVAEKPFGYIDSS